MTCPHSAAIGESAVGHDTHYARNQTDLPDWPQVDVSDRRVVNDPLKY